MGKMSVAKKPSKKEGRMKNPIVIDEPTGLVFGSEDELYEHFLPQIQALEKEFFLHRSADDLPEAEFKRYEDLL